MQRNSTIPRIALYAILILWTVTAAFAEWWLIWANGIGWGGDFNIYFQAVQRALAGESAYLPMSVGNSFVSHPLLLTFLTPLAALPWEWAFGLWTTFSIVCWLSTFKISLRIARFGAEGEPFAWTLGVTMMTFAPFLETLSIGQVNCIVVLGIVLCFYFAESNRPWSAGLCLGLAALLKTSPLLLIPFFLCTRRYRVVLACGATLLLGCVLPVIQFGPQVLTEYLSVVRTISSIVHATKYNHATVLFVLDTLSSLGAEGSSAAWHPETVSRALGQLSLILVAALAGAFILPKTAASYETRLTAFLATLAVSVVFSPLLWYHHMVFHVPALVLLLAAPYGWTRSAGAGLAVLMQTTRLWDYFVATRPLPALVTHLGILATLIALWVTADSRLRVAKKDTSAPGPAFRPAVGLEKRE